MKPMQGEEEMRKSSILFTATLIIFLLIAKLSLAQDTIILKNKEIIRGTIIKSDSKGITVEIKEGEATLTIPQEKILEVKIEKPELFKTAQEYYARGDYASAIDAYKAVAQKYGGYSWGEEAYMMAAQCLIKMNNYPEAAKWYQLFLENFPHAESAPQAESDLADIYFKEKDYPRAMRMYEKLVKEREGEAAARGYYGMGDCYFQQEKFEDALVCYLKIVVLYFEFQDQVAGALLKSAKCYKALGDDKRTIETYEEVIKKFPGTNYAKGANEALISLRGVKK